MRRFKAEQISGDSAYLRGKEARHVLKVLRKRPGDEIVIFDGRGKEFLSVIEAASTQYVKLKIIKELKVNRESYLKTTLYMGITNKLQKFELVLQKATELGVSNITPVICRYSAFAERLKWENKMKRWKEIIVNSAKQCGRNILPSINAPIELSDIEDESESKFVLWEKGGNSFKNYQDLTPTSVALVVGPEGGLAAEEVQELKKKGFSVVSLGKRILRAETAAIAALTLVQFIWGDLG